MPCKSVIHTVGPVFSQRSPDESRRLLQAAYRNSLQEAVRHGLRTVVRMRRKRFAIAYGRRSRPSLRVCICLLYTSPSPRDRG